MRNFIAVLVGAGAIVLAFVLFVLPIIVSVSSAAITGLTNLP